MDTPEVAALYALVAERLKLAHDRVHALNVSTEAKTALTRQLLIVTETAKRDLPGRQGGWRALSKTSTRAPAARMRRRTRKSIATLG
ncbi:hypothetical protein GCM10020229_68740 [Kitasatospora albolonga]